MLCHTVPNVCQHENVLYKYWNQFLGYAHVRWSDSQYLALAQTVHHFVNLKDHYFMLIATQCLVSNSHHTWKFTDTGLCHPQTVDAHQWAITNQ